MKKIYFVTGTDTEVGKTYCSVALLKKFEAHNFSTLGIKPLATGSRWLQGQEFNEDAKALQAAASLKLPYAAINPFLFSSPIAPSLAAMQENVRLSAHRMVEAIAVALSSDVDRIIIEGVGGWFVPLNEQETLADFVKLLSVPVILVVPIKLGCINHAFLTRHALKTAAIPLAGWIANQLDPSVKEPSGLIRLLGKAMDAPCLGILPYQGKAIDYLDISLLN